MRRLLFALLVLVAVVSLALFVAVRARVVLAQRALDEVLLRAAVPGAMATVVSVEADELRLQDLVVGTEPIFRAEELVLEMPWRQLRELRAASATIRDAELRVHWDDDGLSLGSLDPWLASADAASGPDRVPSADAASGAGPPPLPVERIGLERVTLVVGGDFAPLRVSADGELRAVAADRVEAELALVADRGGLLLAGRLEGVAVYREGGWQGRGELVIPETKIDSAWLSLAPEIQDVVLGIRGRVAARGEFALESESLVAGVDLALRGIDLRTAWGRIEGISGSLRGVVADRVEAELRLATDRGGSLPAGRLEGVAVYREGGWQGRGELVIPETKIDSAWLSLAPEIQDVVLGIRGRVAARGEFALESEGLVAGVDLALADIDLRTAWGRIEGISGTLRLEGPEPLSTPPGQLLAIRRIDVGLPLLDGLIEFQLTPEGIIDVRRASWQWAGGTLRAAGAWQPDAAANEVTLQVEALDLGTLLEFAELEGLSGSGRLAGSLPVFQDGEQIRIEGGRLAATGPGTIRLAPGGALGAAARERDEFGLVLDALEDFRFQELSIDIDGDARGETHLVFHLKGSNPNFQAGRSVEFNLNLDAHLADLVRMGATAYDLPEAVQERLESFQSSQEDSR